jgi:hypothetical protein
VANYFQPSGNKKEKKKDNQKDSGYQKNPLLIYLVSAGFAIFKYFVYGVIIRSGQFGQPHTYGINVFIGK